MVRSITQRSRPRLASSSVPRRGSSRVRRLDGRIRGQGRVAPQREPMANLPGKVLAVTRDQWIDILVCIRAEDAINVPIARDNPAFVKRRAVARA